MHILIICMLVLEAVALRSAHAAPKMESAKFQSARGTEITGYYFRPRGDGPFPAVIGMHGCGGLFEQDRKTLSPNRMDWAQRFVNAGYVVLFPDSYQPRGLLSVCEIKPNKWTVKLPDHERANCVRQGAGASRCRAPARRPPPRLPTARPAAEKPRVREPAMRAAELMVSRRRDACAIADSPSHGTV
jgi:hypothetical protein